MIMFILKLILSLLLCVPIGYVLLKLVHNLNGEFRKVKRKELNEKRSFYNGRGSRWSR